ncbi:hypothetical protein PABG_07849 [Paracoccidioides brasiliensis Pb03]|nr:hypothetical protein PABG_07849 [Paracoccidioides brasiliensis Pb03]
MSSLVEIYRAVLFFIDKVKCINQLPIHPIHERLWASASRRPTRTQQQWIIPIIPSQREA